MNEYLITTMEQNTAFIIPAFNEDRVIAHALMSLANITAAENIFVVDDGSTDATAAIAGRYTSNVLSLSGNHGKANALNRGLAHFNLAKRFAYIMPLDADTRLDEKFLKNILPFFAREGEEPATAVVGTVRGSSTNWLTTYRLWEYEIAQTIHKRAQGYLGAIVVCSGPATVYRSDLFLHSSVPTDTVAEDMDLTFGIHRNRHGSITYAAKALAYTQDPRHLKDFIKQLRRWDIGFWQCIYKHNIPWQGQLFDLEVALLALEGLFNGFLLLLIFLMLPIVAITRPDILLIPIALDLVIFLLPTIIYTAIKHKLLKIFFYIPLFYFMRILTSIVFLETFFKVVLTLDSRAGWNRVRRYIAGI